MLAKRAKGRDVVLPCRSERKGFDSPFWRCDGDTRGMSIDRGDSASRSNRIGIIAMVLRAEEIWLAERRRWKFALGFDVCPHKWVVRREKSVGIVIGRDGPQVLGHVPLPSPGMIGRRWGFCLQC